MNLTTVVNLAVINANVSQDNAGPVGIIHQGFKTTYTLALAHLLVIGLIGNTVVIYVVLRFATMQTVTNIHLLSLAVADILYLLSMPFFLTIINMEIFIFGTVGCKIYMMLSGVNWFAGTYSLTVMSVDRYLAVVHPIKSQSIRTPKIAVLLVMSMWIVCFIVMLPVLMYSDVTKSSNYNITICNIMWQGTQGSYAFILYSFFLGFLLPVVAISFFYTMVIHRLRTVGPKNKSKERRDSHKRITRLVLAIIIVYVVLWLPYWTQQILLVTWPSEKRPNLLSNIYLALTCQLFGYLNCTINPFLYAFMSQNFRAMFKQLCDCRDKGGTQIPAGDDIRLPRKKCPSPKWDKESELATVKLDDTRSPLLIEKTDFDEESPTVVVIERHCSAAPVNGIQETDFIDS